MNHSGGVEQHKRGQIFPCKGTGVIEKHLTREGGTGLWLQALPAPEICYFPFGLKADARCRHWYTPEHQIDWLLGDPPAFQHMEPAPFNLGGSLSFSVDEGRLWLEPNELEKLFFSICRISLIDHIWHHSGKREVFRLREQEHIPSWFSLLYSLNMMNIFSPQLS